MGNSGSYEMTHAWEFVQPNNYGQAELDSMVDKAKETFNLLEVFDGWCPNPVNSEDVPDQGSMEVDEDSVPLDHEGAKALFDPHTTEVWKNYCKVVAMYSGGDRERIQKRLKKIGFRLNMFRPQEAPLENCPALYEKWHRIDAGGLSYLAHEIKRISEMTPGSKEAKEAMLVLVQAYQHHKSRDEVTEDSDLTTRAMMLIFHRPRSGIADLMAEMGKYLTLWRAVLDGMQNPGFDTSEGQKDTTTLHGLQDTFDTLVDGLQSVEALDKLKSLQEGLDKFYDLIKEKNLHFTGIEQDLATILPEENQKIREAFLTLVTHRIPQEMVDKAYQGERVPTEDIPKPALSDNILSVETRTKAAGTGGDFNQFAMSWAVKVKGFFGQVMECVLFVTVDSEGGYYNHVVEKKQDQRGEPDTFASGPSFVPVTNPVFKDKASLKVRRQALNKTKKTIREKKKKHFGYLGANRKYRRCRSNVQHKFVFGSVQELQDALKEMEDVATEWIEKQPLSGEGENAYKKHVFMGGPAPRRGRGGCDCGNPNCQNGARFPSDPARMMGLSAMMGQDSRMALMQALMDQ